jgi:hypothetical protein
MEKIIGVLMYVLWIITVLAALATTFMDFKYDDLNFIAGIAFLFAVVNTYFNLTMNKRK